MRKEGAKVTESMAVLGCGRLESLGLNNLLPKSGVNIGQLMESCRTLQGGSAPGESQRTHQACCCPQGTSCHEDDLRATYLQAVENSSKQRRAFPLLAGLEFWEVGLHLEKHLCFSERCQGKFLKHVSCRCSGIEREGGKPRCASFPALFDFHRGGKNLSLARNQEGIVSFVCVQGAEALQG